MDFNFLLSTIEQLNDFIIRHYQSLGVWELLLISHK